LLGISEAFTDETRRRPSSLALFEVLTWGLQSCRDDALLEVHPANIIKLEPKLKRGTKRSNIGSSLEARESAVLDLNDNIFVIATEFISDLVNIIKTDTGQSPALDELCEALVKELHRCEDDLLVDIAPAHIVGIQAKLRKQGKIVSKIGDIVAIPAKDGEYFIGCVLAKNTFGTAYGFFEGTSQSKPVSAASHSPAKRYPIYSGDDFIASGRWKIMGHDANLLTLFPAEPEIYHRENIISDGPEIGPYGAGETASGRLRQLTKEEAEELGLLSGAYSQVYLAEEMEKHLNDTLQ
jgi:hypothetical protein